MIVELPEKFFSPRKGHAPAFLAPPQPKDDYLLAKPRGTAPASPIGVVFDRLI